MTPSSTNNSVFRGFFEKQKLNGPNFIDWYRQLRIVLSIEDKLNYLEHPIPPAPVAPAGQHVASEILAAHNAWIKGSKEIDGLMLMTMDPEIQQNPEPLHAHEMLRELKTLFTQQAEHELLQTTRDFHSCGQEEGYMRKPVNELHAMLKLHEQTLPKSNALALNAIRAGKVQKGNKHKKSQSQIAVKGQNRRKGKNKQAYAPKPKIPPSPKRENPAKDSICHECGIFIIELNTILNRSWIYYSGCGTHICNTTQGLRASRKLKPGALSLYVGNGQRKVVEAISAFYLCLPSGLEIILNNCHYAPSITRGVISVSRFAIPRDRIFEIDLSNSLINESSIYDVSNKRAKLDLDSALLWHYRLGHISKKRIEKLQHDGLLDSSDLRAFEKYVSCMSGKMERKPYTHQVERAKDLLGLIHTDSFWDYALETAARILNMVPTKKVKKTPYEVWHGKAPKLSYLKFWGCEAFVKRDTLTKPDKLEPRSIKCIFVGYLKEMIGYSFYYPPENKVLVARNAEFFENSLINQEESGSLEDLKIIQEEDTHPSINTILNHEEDDLEIDEPQSDIVPIRRSTRTRHAPDRMCLYIDAEEHELGVLVNPLTIKLDRSRRLIGLCQSAYIEKILKRYCMENSKRGSITMQEKLKLSKSQGASTPAELKRMKNVPYASAVGSIMGFFEKQKLNGPNFIDWYRQLRIVLSIKDKLNYLEQPIPPASVAPAGQHVAHEILAAHNAWIKGSKEIDGLMFMTMDPEIQRNPKPLHAHEMLRELKTLFSQQAEHELLQTTRDFHSCRKEEGVVDWKSLKQSIFGTSSAKAEYIAAFDASKEVVWLGKFIYGLGVVPSIEEPISMYYDNTEAIAIANGSGITKGARHFRAKVHYLRKVIEYGDIKLEKVHINDNLADPFTKALAFPKHSKHTMNIRMLQASSLM
nr:hypothetical protein [Tanacetum cinerariifolium]